MTEPADSLYNACFFGQMSVAKKFLREGADTDKAKNTGSTPLYIASQKGFADIAKLLIDKGADLNKPDKDNRTPLFMVCRGGHLDVVKLLIQSNANLNIKSKWGTPLKGAMDGNNPDIVKLLRAAGAKQ